MEVKLRERKGKKKGSLYLAIWQSESRKWRYENLKLYLHRGREHEAQNKETQALAKTIQTLRQMELQSGEYGIIPEHKRKGDFILFFENLANERDQNWRHAARHLKKFSPHPVSFQALNENWLLDFQKFLLKTISENTAWLIEGKLRAGIRIALQQKLIRNNFLLSAKTLRYKQGPRTFLNAKEIRRLIKTPCDNPDLRRAFLFSIFTGLRFSDISALTWRNVEKGFICFTHQKTGEPERLSLNATAKKILFDRDEKIIRMDPDMKVFKMLCPNYTNKLLRIWAKRAGLEKHLTFYVGRHSYAFLLLTSGVELYDVSKAMGHRSVSMTEVYAHMVPQESKKRIDDMLPAFDVGMRMK